MSDRREEDWARRTIAETLGVEVHIHDDNSQDGMYDLRVGSADEPDIAIEVVSAVDAEWLAGWRAGPERGPWTANGVQGDWTVQITANARIKRLRAALPALLGELETRGITGPVDHLMRRRYRDLHDSFKDLGVSYVSCHRADGTGTVTEISAGMGGAVSHDGAAVPSWISDFLASEALSDVRKKLTGIGRQRHVFVPVAFRGAPVEVETYLLIRGGFEGPAQTPAEDPVLPEPITHVWIASTGSPRGVRWDGQRWHLFDTASDVSTDEANTSDKSDS